MSTTFGIKIQIEDFDGDPDFETIEVAFRSSRIRFLNPLAHLLPDETLVEALDNSPQGIYTIGDIKKAIKNQ